MDCVAALGEILLADEGTLRFADSVLNNRFVKRQKSLVSSCFLCGKFKQNMLFKIRAKSWHGHFIGGKRISAPEILMI